MDGARQLSAKYGEEAGSHRTLVVLCSSILPFRLLLFRFGLKPPFLSRKMKGSQIQLFLESYRIAGSLLNAQLWPIGGVSAVPRSEHT